MLEQVIKNIAERAENRNGIELLPIKATLVSVILGSMEEGRNFGPLTMYFNVEKGSYSNYKTYVLCHGFDPHNSYQNITNFAQWLVHNN